MVERGGAQKGGVPSDGPHPPQKKLKSIKLSTLGQRKWSDYIWIRSWKCNLSVIFSRRMWWTFTMLRVGGGTCFYNSNYGFTHDMAWVRLNHESLWLMLELLNDWLRKMISLKHCCYQYLITQNKAQTQFSYNLIFETNESFFFCPVIVLKQRR